MSTITRRPPPPPGWIPSPLARLTVDQYEALIDSGVFTERDRFHLINGLLVAEVPKKRPHMIACDKVGHLLERTIPGGWHVMPDGPVRLPPGSEPQPDFAVRKTGRLPDPCSRGGRFGACRRGLVLDPGRRSQHGGHLRGRPDSGVLDRQSGRSPGRGLHGSGRLRLRDVRRVRTWAIRPLRYRRRSCRPDRCRRYAAPT